MDETNILDILTGPAAALDRHLKQHPCLGAVIVSRDEQGSKESRYDW